MVAESCCLCQWIFQDNAKIASVVPLDKGKSMDILKDD